MLRSPLETIVINDPPASRVGGGDRHALVVVQNPHHDVGAQVAIESKKLNQSITLHLQALNSDTVYPVSGSPEAPNALI
jgi:hypothetical protein